MSSSKLAGIQYPGSNTTDNCLITNFLKDLFARCHEEKKDPGIVIEHTADAIKKPLERIPFTVPAELAYDHLAAAERSIADVSFRYSIIYKDKKPVLFASFQVFTLTAKNFNLDKNKTFVKDILRLFLKLKKAKVLVLGNALRTEADSYCYDTALISKEEAQAAVAAVAEKIAKEDGITAIVLPGIDNSNPETLTDRAYQAPWDDMVMDMTIDPNWKNLQDYMAALSRKYKTRANKIISSGSQLAVRPMTESDIAGYQPDINRLYAAVIDKQSFVFTQSGAEYIATLKQLHGAEFEVMGYFKDDALVAFYSAFINEDNYELYYVGFDTELNNEYHLYFNLLLSGLGRAIELRKQTLKLGRTSFDAKASLGAKPRKTDYLIKLRHIPDAAIKWLVCYFSELEDNRWKKRSPLKVGTVAE